MPGSAKDSGIVLYVNFSMQDEDTALGRLMHDLNCKNADEMYSEVLAQRVSELKETKKEENVGMCDALEELIQEFTQKGEARGEERERKKTAKALSQRGMPVQEIAQILNEEQEKVKEWLAEA